MFNFNLRFFFSSNYRALTSRMPNNNNEISTFFVDSNAKPTGVFPWNQQSSANFGAPQFPSYLPPRPQKPYRPKPQLTPGQDSKITHLGSYLFNGRPESLYLMPPYHNPYASPYHLPNPYQQAAAPLPPTPYNPYGPIYAPPPALPSYY